MIISVVARNSPLSRAQVEEVQKEIQLIHSHVLLQPTWILSTGDKDKKTSLRTLNKTDFFTREADEAVLKRENRIAIHSAKDLPEPIPKGLDVIALTRGVDSSDSLVLREGENLNTLRLGAVVATSSERREDAVRLLRSDLTFIDLRGTIGERLEYLHNRTADGVIVAEAALIRLKLTHLNRITLPGDTTPLQGQLAIVARDDDEEMRILFSCLDIRQEKIKCCSI